MPTDVHKSAPSGDPRPQGRVLGTGTAFLALIGAATAFGLGTFLGQRPALEASSPAPQGPGGLDSDQDGLNDVLEKVLGLDPFEADTDGDGFPDALELALGSNPLDSASVPSSQDLGVGMAAHVQDEVLLLSTLVHLPEANLSGLALGFNARLGGVNYPIDPQTFWTISQITAAKSFNGVDLVLVISTPLPQSILSSFGPLSFFATLGPQGAPPFSAGAVSLLELDGIAHQVVPSSPLDQLYQATSFYRPLVPAEELPVSFTSGKLCVQATRAVGAVPPVIVLEVVSSNCEEADAFCAPSCAFQTGSTVEVLDPLALVGG
jgi:hypothetical protein